MPDKYSLAKCEHYGRRLAARLCQQFFDAQPQATPDGPALLQFTPVRQVNLLVLRQLLGRWQQEATALRSPYFDYEAGPVQAALTQLMNVLSRHIALGRAALEPLLAQAVADTLLLAADPVQAFGRLLLPPGPETTTAATLRESLRYFDQIKPLFEGFVDSLPGTAPLDADFLRQRLSLYLTAHPREAPALDRTVAELSSLLPLTEADLWDDGPSKATPAPPRPAAPASAAPAPAAPAPAAPTPPAAPAPAAPAPVTPAATVAAVAPAAPAARPAPVAAVPAEAAPAAAAPASVAAPALVPAPEAATPAAGQPAPATAAEPKPAAPAAPRQVPADSPAPLPLHEKLKAAQPAAPHLADTLRGAAVTEAPPLAERAAPRVGSLRDGISINQRFSFINELFNEEPAEYQAAVEALDAQPTLEAAQAYVRQQLAARYDWSRKDEHVARLLKLVERKFGGA